MKKVMFKVIHDKKYSLWTMEEDRKLLKQIKLSDSRNKWEKISKIIGKKVNECIKRYKLINPSIKKGLWSSEEDQEVIKLCKIYGTNWAKISKNFHNKNRTGKQIRQRYLNFLEPSINRTKFTLEEDLKILKLNKIYKTNWKYYANHFDHRSPDMIKGRYYSSVRYNVKILNIIDFLTDKNNNDDISSNNNIKTSNYENQYIYNSNQKSIIDSEIKIQSLKLININKDSIGKLIKNKKIFKTKSAAKKNAIKLSNPKSNRAQEFTESVNSLNFNDFYIKKINPTKNQILEKIKELSSIDNSFGRNDMIMDEVDSMLYSGTITLPEFLKEIDMFNAFTESSDLDFERNKSNDYIIFKEEINHNTKQSCNMKIIDLEIKLINLQTYEETEEFQRESEENFDFGYSLYDEEYDQEFNLKFNYFKQKNTDFLI
jgi:hypothetical protein